MNSRKINILAAVLIASVLLLTASIGTVYAYLSATTEEHTDTFIPADAVIPIVSVSPPQTGTATASVTVPNAGYPVYVRAAVVVNWIKINKENRKICATPDGAQYSVSTDGWTENGNFYYYNSAIDASNDVVLQNTITVTYTEVDGYEVQVQVIAQTIQAVGTVDNETNTAVFDAWGVNMP